jgi:23S rRNA (uracil1939-C5)-methyltransferase
VANFFKVSNKKPTKAKYNSNVEVNIDKLDMNGCGVGLYQNKPIFVDGSLPEEKVDIRLLEQKNKFSRGKLLKVKTHSDKRVEVLCPHFSVCGGCDLQHLAYQEQLSFKQKKITELLSRSGIDSGFISQYMWQAPIASQPWHYRRKARIGVQYNKNSQAIIGFRQKGTNQLVPIKSCLTLVKPLSDIFPMLNTLIAKLNVKKSIGHIEVIYTQGKSSEELLTVVVRQLRELTKQDRTLWLFFAKQYQWQVVFDFGKGKYEQLNEQQVLAYTLADNNEITFSSDDFIQVNEGVNQAMIEQALSWLELEPDDQLLDLFCGLGNFSLPIAKKIAKVIGVEGVQSMVDKAKANAMTNQLENCQFYQADLNSAWLDQGWIKNNFTKVLLDPARAGAEQAVIQLGTLAINTILYVSCDPATLARDSKLLLEQGYRISKIGLVDMFPQTKHVETMILFTK